MNTTSFLERVRQTGVLPSTAENWGDTQILAEATEALRTRFAEDIVNTGSGYWRVSQIVNTVAGQNEYRINPRAVVQGLQKFEYSKDGGLTWSLMKIITLGSDGQYESSNVGVPDHFTHYSDYVRVFPTPADNSTQLRFTFYLSPSTLIASVAPGVVSGVVAGKIRITGGDPSGFLSVSGGTLDVINTTGCNEVVMFDVPYSTFTLVSGTTYDITISDSRSLARVAAGQVVRAADTTDQIPLARELHNGFAVYTAASILSNIGDQAQGDKLAQRAANDIRRIIDLSIPRDKAHPMKIKPRNSWLRRNAGRRWR